MKVGDNVNDYIIRKAMPNDAKGIVEVLTYTWQTQYKGLLPDEIIEKRFHTMDERTKKTQEHIMLKNNFYVAEVDNKIVGVLTYGKSRNDNYSSCGEINAIYVLSDYQKKGIGKKLFLTGIKQLLNDGYQSMILNILKGNNTINFYEYFGGKIMESRFELFGETTIEEYIMKFDDLQNIISKYSEENKKQFI